MSHSPDPEERLAWALLHAAQVPARARAVVIEGGGPAHFLGAALRMRQSRFAFIETEVRARLRRFVDEGGHILGGPAPAELGRLDRASSPPLCAYARGAPALLQRTPAVAVIGTRKPSADGQRRAQEIARGLAAAGVVVVSGGALGIDTCAHEAALAAGGTTVAVLGAPVGHPAEPPRQVRALFDPGTAGRVCAVAVHAAGVAMAKGLFVSRNRYIAALSDAVIVVEGRRQSGTLHTARAAKKMGIDVYAVPGPPEDEGCRAPNQLLAHGAARALLDVADVVRAVGGTPPGRAPPARAGAAPGGLLAYLAERGGEASVDEVAAGLGWPVHKVQQEALHQELFGAVEREGVALRLRS